MPSQNRWPLSPKTFRQRTTIRHSVKAERFRYSQMLDRCAGRNPIKRLVLHLSRKSWLNWRPKSCGRQCHLQGMSEAWFGVVHMETKLCKVPDVCKQLRWPTLPRLTTCICHVPKQHSKQVTSHSLPLNLSYFDAFALIIFTPWTAKRTMLIICSTASREILGIYLTLQ